jgi:hypothetical protein
MVATYHLVGGYARRQLRRKSSVLEKVVYPVVRVYLTDVIQVAEIILKYFPQNVLLNSDDYRGVRE